MSIFVPAATNIHLRSLGSHWKTGLFVCFHVSRYYTGALVKKNENLWESLGDIMVNGALGRSLKGRLGEFSG